MIHIADLASIYERGFSYEEYQAALAGYTQQPYQSLLTPVISADQELIGSLLHRGSRILAFVSHTCHDCIVCFPILQAIAATRDVPIRVVWYDDYRAEAKRLGCGSEARLPLFSFIHTNGNEYVRFIGGLGLRVLPNM